MIVICFNLNVKFNYFETSLNSHGFNLNVKFNYFPYSLRTATSSIWYLKALFNNS